MENRILKNMARELHVWTADFLLYHADCNSEIYTNMSFKGILNFKHLHLSLEFRYLDYIKSALACYFMSSVLFERLESSSIKKNQQTHHIIFPSILCYYS